MGDTTGRKALNFIGALSQGAEAEEIVDFHSRLLTAHLAALQELSLYHESYPWKVCCALDPSCVSDLLRDMEQCWQFTLGFADSLRTTEKLYNTLLFTRWQPFRDVFVKAEYLDLTLTSKMTQAQMYPKFFGNKIC